MGKKSRSKGAAFERETAAKLRRIWPEARRGGHDQAGPMGRPDVDGTPYWVECKRYAHVTRGIVKSAHKQAIQAAVRACDDRAALVITRSDRAAAMVHYQVATVRPDTGTRIVVLMSVPLAAWLDAVETPQ